ncbi:drug/metabolite transporter (DMT)-like permease [Rhodovulum bhavnagarense]|uniref:Drug/metabolite transporter (DMT)-like permease n=1 Tax=Rhodovulum bhavnagarense TaxID=992286 RepID=A0A4R2RDF8_9RHOB|nr:DMT family transporter [Rhodovulum bhavnagarense]TCP60219.1 drug/metabolite transporter (DMT)-like permease [Rhodovulum bhavnagarense]
MVPLSDNLRGAALMTGAMAAFTFNDACMKALSDEVPFFQALFLRGLGTVALLALAATMLGGVRLRIPRRDMGFMLLRTGAEIGAAYFFITALFHAPLANVTAIIQAIPLSVTLAGALFLGEAVGWRRWLAIGIGFAGVLLIVRPGSEGVNIHSVYALVAVAFVTLRDLATRRLSGAVPSITVAFAAAAGVTLFAATGAAASDWAPMSGLSIIQLCAASILVIAGYLCSVMAMRVGEVAIVAPFRYTSLIWALALGVVIFGERPSGLTLAGAAIVVATGIYTFHRERRLARKPGPAPLRPR